MKIVFKPLRHKGFTPTPTVKEQQSNTQLVWGFTLAELLIAMAILSVVIAGLLLFFIFSALLAQSNNNLAVASNDAQYVLEQIKELAYANIDTYNAPSFSNLSNETASVTVQDYAKYKTLTVNISWRERGGLKNFSLSTEVARQ